MLIFLMLFFSNILNASVNDCNQGKVVSLGYKLIDYSHVCFEETGCYVPEQCPLESSEEIFCKDGSIIQMGYYRLPNGLVCPKKPGCFNKKYCVESKVSGCNGQLVNMGFYEVGPKYVCPRIQGCYEHRLCR